MQSRALRSLAVLAIVGGLLGFGALCREAGRVDGQAAERARGERRQAAALAAAQAREQQAAAIAVRIGADHAQQQTEIRTRTRTLERLVPRLVTADDDRRCVVNRGFVRAYDAAAAGELPAAAGEPADAAADVPLSEVASVSVAAFGVCHQLRASVLAWQAWYAETAALYAPPAPASLAVAR